MSDASDDGIEDLSEDEEDHIVTKPDSAEKAETRVKSKAGVTGKDDINGEEGQTEEETIEEEPLRSEDFISQVFLSAACTLPANILEYHHSFAYDCGRMYNLCVADEETLVYASGNLVHFFNLLTREVWCRRSAGGGGIGHITKHPTLPHLAVGEKGDNPLIIIYHWPSLDIVSVLRDGTVRSYCVLDYSPDGALLCSQGGEPDLMLTIWDWRKSKIILRRKAHGQKVINAVFSPYVPGHLATSGVGHIKFWRMVETFTGLKLLGELGRFGKTEMCDIIGMMPLPDEKVMSGSAWGNLLLWDEGLIKLEVTRRHRLNCHKGAITQMSFSRPEKVLTSVGMDGVVQLWFFATIEAADPPQHDRVVETQPYLEFKIGEQGMTAALMCLHKLRTDAKAANQWVAQDANGGLWVFAIDRDVVSESEKILSCHSGGVMDLAMSPHENYVASLGKGGRLHFYDYINRTLLIRKRYPAGGACFIWLSTSNEYRDSVVVAAFLDGTMRVIVPSLAERVSFGDAGSEFLTLIQVIKPHSMPITTIAVNKDHSLVVSGSEDETLFIHAVVVKGEYVALSPVGFIKLPGIVMFINWKPDTASTVLVCCHNGYLLEMDLPKRSQAHSATTYELTNVPTRTIRFQTVKAQIRRDIKLKEIQARKDKKVELKRIDFEKLKADNPGLDFDEETFLEDSESEEELEPLHVPATPNRILFALYTVEGTLWLSMGGYDAGYVYEYSFEGAGAISATMVQDADDTEILTYVYNHDKSYLILGMQDGKIRVNRVNPKNFRDLKDYWLLAMHDNDYGTIRRISFSFDQRYVFTGGIDGNIFSFQWKPERDDFVLPSRRSSLSKGVPPDAVDDIEERRTVLSYEETKTKQAHARLEKMTNQHREETEKMLAKLKADFNRIRQRNNELPSALAFPPENFEVDPRITAEVRQVLQGEMDVAKRKTLFAKEKSNLGLTKATDYFVGVLQSFACTVLGIDRNVQSTTYRHRALTRQYYEALDGVNTRIAEADKRDRDQKRKVSIARLIDQVRPVKAAESFLMGLDMTAPELRDSPKLNKMLERYRARKRKREEREAEWDEHRRSEPHADQADVDDRAAFDEARHSVGDFKLKASKDYRVPRNKRVSTVKKYKELLVARQRLFDVQERYNLNVFYLREKKQELIEHIKNQNKILSEIYEEFGDGETGHCHPVPQIYYEHEYPELEYRLSEDDILDQMATRTGVDLWKVVYVETKKRIRLTRDFAEEYEALMYEDSQPWDLLPDESSMDSMRKLSEQDFAAISQVSIGFLEQLADTNTRDTPWESDLKRIHLAELLFQQCEIMTDVKIRIREFDDDIAHLQEARHRVDVDVKVLELFILQLDQELIILKVFESREDFLSDEVQLRFIADEDMMIAIKAYNREMDARNKEIFRLTEKQKVITSSFVKLTAGNKFANHLRKIFKKKYKPPKDESDETDDSICSDDTTTDEDDRKSMDSHEFGALQLDETIRPEGCDKDIFDVTFIMRAERHQLELESGEHKKLLEATKKDCESAQRRKKVLQAALVKSQETLDEFQREKQKKLNEVDVVVLLKCDSLRHFVGKHRMAPLADTLVFSIDVLAELFNRPTDLLTQRILQRTKHMELRKQRQQFKLECGHMDAETKNLKARIVDCKTKKFGSVVDVNYLEEALLRRMIAKLRSTDEYRRKQDKLVEAMKEEKRELRDRMCCAVKENTEKLNVLIVLEADSHRLRLEMHRRDVKKVNRHKEYAYKEDCAELRELAREQRKQIACLKAEISKLSGRAGATSGADTSTGGIVRPIPVTTIGGPDAAPGEHRSQESIPSVSDQPCVSITKFVQLVIDQLVSKATEPPETSPELDAVDEREASMLSLRAACAGIVEGLVESIGARRDDLAPTDSDPDLTVERDVQDMIRKIVDGIVVADCRATIDTMRVMSTGIVNTIVDSLGAGQQLVTIRESEEIDVKSIISEILLRLHSQQASEDEATE